MRLAIMSDLHYEFHRDGGRAFTASLDPTGIDALIVAGDLGTENVLAMALTMLCKRYPWVFYVPGNHEFYNTHRERVTRAVDKALRRSPNLSVLNRDIVEFEGQRFLGATLWFRKDDHAPKDDMTDFKVIRNFEGWVYEENAKSIEFFRRELRPGDIAISHHLPSPRSIAPAYSDHPLNPFFVCDIEDVIVSKQPVLWVHGHTHESLDYQIGPTRVVCNPFGYAAVEENTRFNQTFSVEVPGVTRVP